MASTSIMKTCLLLLALATALTEITATDIAAVYKHSVLLIKDADEISKSQISWESAELDLPEPLAYPVGIASDPQNRRLFVTDVMHRENTIFTLQFSSNGSIDTMHPLIKKTHTKDIRLIEDIIYDGRTSQLYWTDSYLSSLDKAHVPENPKDMLTERPKSVHNFGSVKKPRGVALDYCNNLLYWSELDDKERNIEVCNLDGKYLGVVRTASDTSNKYFLGMTYDMSSGHVIWGETDGKEPTNSTCRIFSSEFRGTSDHEAVLQPLAELDNCYPFALTSDDKYIYWADWGRNGIMRLSKTNPDQIVKILNAPKVKSDEGTHHGVFGLTVLGGPSIEEIEKNCSHHHTYLDKPEITRNVPELELPEQNIKVLKRVETALDSVTKKPEKSTEVPLSTPLPNVPKSTKVPLSTPLPNIPKSTKVPLSTPLPNVPKSTKVLLSTPVPNFPKSTKKIVAKISSTEARESEKQAQPVTEVKRKSEIMSKPFNSQEPKDMQRATESIQEQILVIKSQEDKEEHQSVIQDLDRILVDSEDYQSSQSTADEKNELLKMVKSDGHINASFSPKKCIVFTLVALLHAFYANFYAYL